MARPLCFTATTTPRRLARPVVDALTRHLEACARALDDAPEAKRAIEPLRESADTTARFAAALFDLELARRGDVENRAKLSVLADELMAFWRDGRGDELAWRYPVLAPLWAGTASMLVRFERQRFELGLALCWKVRGDSEQLLSAIDTLEPRGQRHVEFARCLYHLELSRRGVEQSREEFASRVQLVADAYHDVTLANDLIGADAGLRYLWTELRPYLDEFFESLEESLARTQEVTRRVKMPQPPDAPPEEPPQELTLPNRPAPERPSGLFNVATDDDLLIEAELAAPSPDDEELDIELDTTEEATSAFWTYTFAALKVAPASGVQPRMLATESREERRRLTDYLDGLRPHEEVPEARTFATLVRLLLAQEAKEKTLFGQPNQRRKEALLAALGSLSADAEAAGRAAVWFEFDGPQTREALFRGLELLMPYLSFCERAQVDPLSPAAVARYLA